MNICSLSETKKKVEENYIEHFLLIYNRKNKNERMLNWTLSHQSIER